MKSAEEPAGPGEDGVSHEINRHRQPDDHDDHGRDMGEKFQEVGLEQANRVFAVTDGKVGHTSNISSQLIYL